MTPTDENPTLAAQIEALCKRVFLAAHSDGWRGNQLRRVTANVDADKSWDAYVGNGALAKSIAVQPAIVTALRQAEAAPGVVDPIVRWIDQAIERCNKHGNTEGIWLFASQWQTVRDILALARQHGAREDVTPHVFLDCDGVLADFDTYAEAYFGMPPRQYEKQMGSSRFWQELEAKGDFYRNLPLMPDAMALYEAVKHLHPTILTGCPRGDWAQGQKVAWAAEHFPGVPIITCRSADKRDYAKPGDILIDDWPQHRHRWIEMGGVFIVHHDAESSLAALRAHYPKLPAAPATDVGEAV